MSANPNFSVLSSTFIALAVIPHMIRASKAAEVVSLEQWKREYHECDEKLRRFVVSLC